MSPLQKAWTTKTGYTADFIKLAERLFQKEVGHIIYEGYKDAESYVAGTLPVDRVQIPLGVDTKKSNGVFTRIKFSSIEGKTESQIDIAAKTGKIKWESGITVDLSDAVEV